MRKAPFLLFFLLTACSLPAATQPAPTADVNVILTQAVATAFTRMTQTAVALPPTMTPDLPPGVTPSITPTASPTNAPTIEPMTGILLAPTNVRNGPGKGGNDRIGGLYFNQTVKVIGRNDAANWLYIVFADSPTGTGWVLKNAIDLKGEMGNLPIVIYPDGSDTPRILPPLIQTISGTPLPLNAPPAGAKTASVTQLTNVRVGPSVGYLVLGVLQPGAVVTMTGRLQANAWVQIDYPSGLEGHAWISTSLLKPADGYSGLPYFNLLATPETDAKPTESGANATPLSTSDASVATPQPTQTTAPVSPTPIGPTGHAKAQINVRVGPAQTFDSLGLLNKGDLVLITGRNLIGNWLQIEYPPASLKRGWVATDYIDLNGVNISKLPYYDNQGTPIP
jgi:uncharacterized protein YgiM (DUF1202 family)